MSGTERWSAARIAVDGGQSGMRIRVITVDGTRDERDAPAVTTDRPVVPQVAAAIVTALGDAELGPIEIGVGLSGLTDSAADAAGLLAALEPLGAVRAVLAHDSVTAYLGANGSALGAVTAAGTGVVTLGVGASVARVDGWGYLFGDAGSAYWIGRAGFDAALRSFDGRAERTALLDAVIERFGDPAELYMTVQANPGRVALVASFAKTVADVADSGDAAAIAVLRRAGVELAGSAVAAIERSGHPAQPTVSWAGTVLRANRLVRDTFAREVVRLVPDAVVREPVGIPLDGAEALLDLAPTHPLAGAASAASTEGAPRA